MLSSPEEKPKQYYDGRGFWILLILRAAALFYPPLKQFIVDNIEGLVALEVIAWAGLNQIPRLKKWLNGNNQIPPSSSSPTARP